MHNIYFMLVMAVQVVFTNTELIFLVYAKQTVLFISLPHQIDIISRWI